MLRCSGRLGSGLRNFRNLPPFIVIGCTTLDGKFQKFAAPTPVGWLASGRCRGHDISSLTFDAFSCSTKPKTAKFEIS